MNACDYNLLWSYPLRQDKFTIEVYTQDGFSCCGHSTIYKPLNGTQDYPLFLVLKNVSRCSVTSIIPRWKFSWPCALKDTGYNV